MPTKGKPEDVRRRNKRWKYLRDTGQGSQMGPQAGAEARAHLEWLHGQGMSLPMMSRQSGLSQSTLSWSMKRPPTDGIFRSTHTKIMRLTLDVTRPDRESGAVLDPTGTCRRLRALWAEGHPQSCIAEQLGWYHAGHRSNVGYYLHYRARITHADFAERVKVLYEKMAGNDPLAFGATPHGVKVAKTYARKYDAAPPWCWDEDTIDDPEAIPEWTGMCGTNDGWMIHRRESIPICGPCGAAHAVFEGASNAKYSRTEIEQHLMDGGTAKEVAALVGCTERTVYHIRTAAQKRGEVFPEHHNRKKGKDGQD